MTILMRVCGDESENRYLHQLLVKGTEDSAAGHPCPTALHHSTGASPALSFSSFQS